MDLSTGCTRDSSPDRQCLAPNCGGGAGKRRPPSAWSVEAPTLPFLTRGRNKTTCNPNPTLFGHHQRRQRPRRHLGIEPKQRRPTRTEPAIATMETLRGIFAKPDPDAQVLCLNLANQNPRRQAAKSNSRYPPMTGPKMQDGHPLQHPQARSRHRVGQASRNEI